MSTHTPLRLTQIDLLESLPAMIGHTPNRSIVVVLADAAAGQVTLTIRLDLPQTVEDVPETVASLETTIRNKRVKWSGATIAVWDETDERKAVHVETLTALYNMITRLGRGVHGAFHVGATHITGTGQETRNQEVAHVERDRSRGDRATLQAMIAGRAPLDSREEVAQSVEGHSAEEVTDLDEFAAQVRDTETTRARALPAWLDVLENGPTQDTDIALLAASVLVDRELRDGIIIYAGGGATDALDMVPEQIAQPLREAMPRRTHTERLEVVEHLRQVVTRLEDVVAVPVLTMLTAVAHEARLSILSTVALERAQRIDPTYYLANLLRSMVENGIYATAMAPLP